MTGFQQMVFRQSSGWIKKSVIFLINYLNPKTTQQIDRRVTGSKEKMKISCPSVVAHEYN